MPMRNGIDYVNLDATPDWSIWGVEVGDERRYSHIMVEEGRFLGEVVEQSETSTLTRVEEAYSVEFDTLDAAEIATAILRLVAPERLNALWLKA